MDPRNTVLPGNIKRILKRHRRGLFSINKFLVSVGFDSNWLHEDTEKLDRITSMDIIVRHDNDYIECGPCFDDPLGKLYNIYTAIEVEPVIDIVKFPAAVKRLETFANVLGRYKDSKPKGMDHILLSYYSWQRSIKAVDFRPDRISHTLKFNIYHMWR